MIGRAYRYLLCILLLGLPDFASAATIGKLSPGGDILYVRLSADEAQAFAAGALVTVETEAGDLSGMVLSKKGTRARIKLDQPSKGLTATMEIRLLPADPTVTGQVSTTPPPQLAFPAAAAINVIRSPASPWTTYIDTAGSGTTDGSGSEIFSTFNFLTMNTAFQYLFLFDQIQVGPEFSYFQSTNKITNNSSVDGEAVEIDPVQIKYTQTEFGILGKYLFRPYQPYTFNPLAYLGFAMSSFTREIADKDPQKADVQTIKIGFGVQYFLTPSFAFEGDFQYRMDTVKFTETEIGDVTGEATEAQITDESITHNLASMGINYGLAFYF